LFEGEKWVRANVLLSGAPDIQILTNKISEIEKFHAYLLENHNDLTVTQQ